jgi:hypothetical protein
MQFINAIKKEDGEKVVKILKFWHLPIDVSQIRRSAIDPKWIEIIELHNEIKASRLDLSSIAQLHNKQTQSFHVLFSSCGRWALPLLYAFFAPFNDSRYHFNEILMKVHAYVC